jgi:hypothetical protein
MRMCLIVGIIILLVVIIVPSGMCWCSGATHWGSLTIPQSLLRRNKRPHTRYHEPYPLIIVRDATCCIAMGDAEDGYECTRLTTLILAGFVSMANRERCTGSFLLAFVSIRIGRPAVTNSYVRPGCSASATIPGKPRCRHGRRTINGVLFCTLVFVSFYVAELHPLFNCSSRDNLSAAAAASRTRVPRYKAR